MMFTKDDIFEGMQGLSLPDQVSVLEQTLHEVGIADFADVLAMCLMCLCLDLEDADVPDALIARVNVLKATLHKHNKARFNSPPEAEK